MNLKYVTTNFDFEFFQNIPLRSNEQAPTSLTLFREHLVSSHRLSEARAILDVELGICANNNDQVSACESILEGCTLHEARDPIWLVVGRARLRLAHLLHVSGQSEQATHQFDCARQWLIAAGAPGRSNRNDLLCRLQELKDSSPMTEDGFSVSDVGLLQRYENFLDDRDVKNDSYVLSTALCRGIDVAIAILEKDTSAFNRDIFWKWLRRTETALEELGDITRLYINRRATGDIACTLFGDFGTLIEWYEEFDKKYPTFDLWRQKISMKKTLVLMYQQIRNEYQALRTIKEIKEISASQDIFWQAEGFRPQFQVSSQSAVTKTNENLLPVAFQADFKGLDWLLHDSTSLPAQSWMTWERVRIKFGSDRKDISTEVEELLLKLMKDDFGAGVLTREDLKSLCSGLFVEATSVSSSQLLHRSDAQNPTTAPVSYANQSFGEALSPSEFLETLSPASLSIMLYGTADSPTPDQQWGQIFETLTLWLLNRSSEPEKIRHYLLFQIQDTRQRRTNISRTNTSSSSFESQVTESQRLIDLIPRLNPLVQEQVSSNIPALRNLIASSKSAIYLRKNGQPFFDTERPEFQEILGLYNQSLKENKGNGRFVREAQTYVDIAHLYFYAALKLNQSALDPFFQALLNALAALEKVREGWQALQGWERVQNLTHALKDPYMMNIVPWAVAVLTQFPDSHINVRDSRIWSMVQVAKSLGLGWLMEINASIARDSQGTTKTVVDDNPKGQDLSKKKDSNCAQPPETKSGETFESENGESSHQSNPSGPESEQVNDPSNDGEEDRDHSPPAPIAETEGRERTEKSHCEHGPYTLLEDLEAQLQQLSNVGGDCVFVDWYNGTSKLRSFLKPLIISIAPGQRPKCYLANITWEEVNKTVEKFVRLSSEDLKSEKKTKILYKLNPLIEPIKHFSKPGQILVFSAWGDLHRIPLHALKLDGEILIHRNPIVYCSSLGALTISFETRQEQENRIAAKSSSHQSAFFKASVYGEPPSEIGQKALHTTASMLGVPQLHIDKQFKSSLFVQTIQDPSLHVLHYHGHAHFSSSSPMDQSLSFTDHHLPLSEIFDITPGRRGFHATLLGCGSGASKTVVTNDVIGLGPALFHAGASSTVSSLWPFADTNAALYEESFYEEFARYQDEGGKRLERAFGTMRINQKDAEEAKVSNVGFTWNLAVANQRAVLKIMEHKPALYHWANFVLNGWWIMRVPGQTERGCQ